MLKQRNEKDRKWKGGWARKLPIGLVQCKTNQLKVQLTKMFNKCFINFSWEALKKQK